MDANGTHLVKALHELRHVLLMLNVSFESQEAITITVDPLTAAKLTLELSEVFEFYNDLPDPLPRGYLGRVCGFQFKSLPDTSDAYIEQELRMREITDKINKGIL